jgi:hypothetical protein
MANIFQIKRSTSTAAPASLAYGELAYSELSEKLFIGANGGGVVAIAGEGMGYLTGNQSINVTGDATGSGATDIELTLADSGVTAGEYTKVTVDSKGRVTSATTLVAADIPSLLAAKISDFDAQVRTSRLDQMATPTAAVSMGSQRVTSVAAPTADSDAATKVYVDTAVANLVAAAPEALDTLNELAAALGNDANFATTVSTSLGEKMAKANNLSDLADASAARTNLGVEIGTDVQAHSATLDSLSGISATALAGVEGISSYGASLMDDADAAAARSTLGLGSMAVQAASSVAITGGTISGITLDGGTF